MELNNDISSIKGVGIKRKELLNKIGIFSIEDLLLYLPRTYNVVTFCDDYNKLREQQYVIVRGKVSKINNDYRKSKNFVMSSVVLDFYDKKISCRWFNQPYAKRLFVVGNTYNILALVKYFNDVPYLINGIILKDDECTNKIVPIYPSTQGLTSKNIDTIIQNLLKTIIIKENLPHEIINKNNLCSLDFAIRNVHTPLNMNDLEIAKRRLKYQELLSYFLKIFMLKEYMINKTKGIEFSIVKELKDIKEILPYDLTKAQSRAVREILLDERKSVPMNRLLQGDVGSGKTIVALIAIFNVIMNGYQSALMAPTEILAKQHFATASELFKGFSINVSLLVGSMSEKEKKTIKENLLEGKINLIIGTHALIEDDVKFLNLGIVVTDEQHRFGVAQRNKLLNKGKNVDVLVMSATPIPRTLSLYIYGDLDISIIDELPPNRKIIQTSYMDKKYRNNAYEFAKKEIINGRQAYVVCPLVEESESIDASSVTEIYDELRKKYFYNIPIAIIHGGMNSSEKNKIMENFHRGNIKVLISTTVIEVGINVPNATVMIIENAERFGLSQLHQLRGRVGRGEYKSFCIMIADVKNEKIKQRMEILKNSNDGFYISEQDLNLRGSGEVFGINQHGENGLIIADLYEDFDIIEIAHEEARILSKTENIELQEYKNAIYDNIQHNSKLICFN